MAPRLPKGLSRAKPKYADFDLRFESDVDRAAYISAQTVKSKQDAAYLKFVVDSTGMTEAQAREHGLRVKATIRLMAKNAAPGTITVPEVKPPK